MKENIENIILCTAKLCNLTHACICYLCIFLHKDLSCKQPQRELFKKKQICNMSVL